MGAVMFLYLICIFIFSASFANEADSLYLSIVTIPGEANISLNAKPCTLSPADSVLVMYQNHFLLEIEKDGYIPYSFLVKKPFGHYRLECELISDSQSEIMQDQIDKMFYKKYREPSVIFTILATIGTGYLNNRAESEWNEYKSIRQLGLTPEDNNIESYVNWTQRLALTLPIALTFPIYTNYNIDKSVRYSGINRYRYDTLRIKAQKTNALYNCAACFAGWYVLNSIQKTVNSRENSQYWAQEFPNTETSNSLKLSANVLLLYGAIELIHWQILSSNIPSITEFVDFVLQ